MTQARKSLDKIVEEQIKRWQLDQKKKYKKPIRPVITMSRLPGAGANSIAARLAKELDIDLFDSQIVERIAENSKVSKKIVESLDEQDRSILDEWLQALAEERMWSYEYLQHLTHVVFAIGTHGHALIMGRGASFILPEEVCLRVLVVAPLQTRVDNVIKAYNVPEEEAKKRVLMTEANRIAFIRKYFNKDMLDPLNYDLVLNTKNLNIDAAVNIVKDAFNTRHWYNYSVKK
ncbi:MAG TPA: cytidylate kinase-like family protein [Syntrophales bacterium]|nr:cytidylate kinase-like family protein [Syntrophales bacterium]HPQ06589.1 cytidylate kinase-like family protein [Syntrophales bacterium]HRS49025.1 cytidylate kinase-like family protein [Thermovirgaceae bacterium]HRV43516.1 cytidylate kinase-like family protein [Syntrophales bacterium]